MASTRGRYHGAKFQCARQRPEFVLLSVKTFGSNEMLLDHQIEEKREKAAALLTQLNNVRSELHILFQKKALEICPLKVGTTIAYTIGKYGRVDRIGFHIDAENELLAHAPIQWTVSGKKINQNRQLGKLNFSPVGPATHQWDNAGFKKKRLIVETNVATIDFNTPLIFDLMARRRVM